MCKEIHTVWGGGGGGIRGGVDEANLPARMSLII